MRVLKILFFLLITSLFTVEVRSQDFGGGAEESIFLDTLFDNSFNLNIDISKQLISLDSIIYIAVNNNPDVLFRNALIKEREHNLRAVKRTWQNNLFGSVDYNTGNQSVLLTGQTESTNITNGYRAGVSLRLPLYEFFGRRNQINQAKYEIEASNQEKRRAVMETKQLITSNYYDVVFAQRVLRSSSNNIQTQQIALEIAERQFKQGGIPIGEYSRVMNQFNIAQQQFQASLKSFYSAYYNFEIIVGVPMVQLRK